MDKLLADLIRSEAKLKYIEEQCKYFENQALKERNEIKKIINVLSLQPPEKQLTEDYVFTEPLTWPSVPDPRYVCNSCCTEIKDVRWHTDELNFDLCDFCHIMCIRGHAKYITNSKYGHLDGICVTELKKIPIIRN